MSKILIGIDPDVDKSVKTPIEILEGKSHFIVNNNGIKTYHIVNRTGKFIYFIQVKRSCYYNYIKNLRNENRH